MDSSTDEFFGTLGGSLMKDLLADLQVGDNDFSLAELERELASMDHAPSLDQQPLPSLNAASMIVSHAQGRSMPHSGTTTTNTVGPPGLAGTTDAWSLSLEKFTSLSLQDDFLAADSARKQTNPVSQSIASLLGAEDYDIQEKQILIPPPGLGGGGVQPSTSQQEFSIPSENSIRIGAENTQTANDAPKIDQSQKVPMAGTTLPANNSIPPPTNSWGMPPQGAVMLPPRQQQQQQGNMLQSAPQGIVPNPHHVHAPPMAVPMQMGMPMAMQMQMPMNVPPMMGTPVTAPITGVVVGAAMSTPGPAWQTPPMAPRPPPPPPQQYQKIFCNPYPRAPPVPATVLSSSCMSARDIAYVVHAILRPVLAAGMSENDYYLQYVKRRVDPQANPINPKFVKDINREMTSRQSKSKEWATDKSVLGHVTKSNVARPRALIATPQPSADQDNMEQKQRANLWKSRVYCDQAYQSYQNVIDIWRAAPPGGGIPPQVQLHLVKLMKCMGIVLDNEKKVYTVSGDALKLVVKLEKGRTLICRVLEQALLPPNAVQALLPVLLETIISLPPSRNESGSNGAAKQTGNGSNVDGPTIERLFRSMASIIHKLNINGDTLLKCFQVFLSHGKPSFSSNVRMECLHSLLQKGAVVIPQSPSEGVKEAWGQAEQKFVSTL